MSKSNHNEDKFASKANRASKYMKKNMLSKSNHNDYQDNEYEFTQRYSELNYENIE